MRWLIFLLLSWTIRAAGPTPYEYPKLRNFPEPASPADNPTTIEGALLGRYLFYDPVLSHDSTVSCSSCHRQENAFADAAADFSSPRKGAPMKRNTPPLFNVVYHSDFFWDGRSPSLEDQVSHPVHDSREFNSNWAEITRKLQKSELYPSLFNAAFPGRAIDSTTVSKAIAQFERTLLSVNAPLDQSRRGEGQLSELAVRGFEIVTDQSMGGCFLCHQIDGFPLGTDLSYRNNGLSEAQIRADSGRAAITGNRSEVGAFKVPSLRNVAVTAPYMHDGRFETLEEVLEFYSSGIANTPYSDTRMSQAHRGGRLFSDGDRRAIIAFLHALTDSTLLSNPEFSDPFADTY
ncbi:MAG: cytochrome-c peroxidase [Flavobacteriales bacterium]|nr:cytochrome-c peroxidase [Flavobacteriales bacterium]